MKKITLLSASVVAALAVAGQAYAADTHSPYVFNKEGQVVRNGVGECLYNGHEKVTPENALAECNPELVAKPQPKLAAEPAKPLVEPPPAPEMKTVTLTADTYFDFDKSNLKPAGKDALNTMISQMGDMNSIAKVKVVGYTDSIGTEQYNLGLSKRRAKTVADYLMKNGNVPADKIEQVGMGEADPVASNKTREGRAKNRRVVVTTEGVSQ